MIPLHERRGEMLAQSDGVPLYRQIYEHFAGAIRAGQLRPADRLPSARALAAQFGTARGTVDTAYAMLAGEGYVVARGAAGTIVSPELGSDIGKFATRRRTAEKWPAPVLHEPGPFQLGLPA